MLSEKEAIKELNNISGSADEVKWRYARLFHEYAPAGNKGRPPEGVDNNAKLQSLLEKSEADMKFNTATQYRNVARAYSREQQGIASFFVHQLLAPHPDRYELVKTKMRAKEADKLIGRVRASNTPIYKADPFVNIRDALSRVETAQRKIALSSRTHPRNEEIIEICYKIATAAMQVVDLVGEKALV